MTEDLSEVLLRRAVRTLPSPQEEWGAAMVAELAAVDGRWQRAQFAVGCVAAVLRRPVGLFVVLQGVVTVMALAGAVGLAWAIGVAEVRLEALCLIAVLVLAFLVLRGPVGFGPVAGGLGARIFAAGGVATLAAELMLELRQLSVDPPLMLPINATVGVFDRDRARAHLVELAVLSSILLVGVTRATARRSAAHPATMARTGTVSAAAAGAWLAFTLIRADVATSVGPALLTASGAVLVAGLLSVRATRHGASAADADPVSAAQPLVAGLLAAAATTALLGLLMDLLPLTGHWIANNAPPNYDEPAPTRVAETAGVWLPCVIFSLALAVTPRRSPLQPRALRRSGRAAHRADVPQ